MEDQNLYDWGFGNQKEKEVVSLNNFIILFFLTMGLYGAWWMYKAWQYFKQKDNLDIMPAMRTIFSIFFLYELMERIQEFAHSKGYSETYSSGSLFIGFVILNLLPQLPGPMWVLSALAFLFLIPPFKAFNFALTKSDGFMERENFNQRQIFLVFMGLMLWGTTIFELFV